MPENDFSLSAIESSGKSNAENPRRLRRARGLTFSALALFAAVAMVPCDGGGAGLSSGGGGHSLGASASAVSTGPGICGTDAIPLSSASCARDAADNIEIGAGGCGPKVYVDKADARFKTITIDSGATLCFPDRTARMEIGTILVSGTLQIGQKTHPIGTDDPSTQVRLDFVGDKNTPATTNSNCVDPVAPTPFRKGIEVCSGGSLEMYGIKGVPPNGLDWTYLSGPAGPPRKYSKSSGATAPVASGGDELLHVAEDVGAGAGAWRRGDWIAVGGTSFSPFETEIVKIADIKSKPADNPTGSDIYLDASTLLTHYHYGSQAPTPSQLCTVDGTLTAVACGSVSGCTSACTSQPSPLNYGDPAAQNYGIDERAPVALISRSIKLTATTHKTDPGSIHWGGELKFLANFSEVSIQGVELQKFGKDQLGSYPIHFHMDGDVGNKPLVDSNTVDHSYNKCVTVHLTKNLTISNNVCVRAVDSLFYEETGAESGITFEHNLGIGAMSNSFDINGTADKRAELIRKYWWTGDYMTNNSESPSHIGYNGFDIPDMDDRTNPVRGSCAALNSAGEPYGYTAPVQGECSAQFPIYIEPASGFYITNPATQLLDNVIDGCQGVGVGYWYLPPPIQPADSKYPQVNFNQYQPVGAFRNNRVTACYNGLYDEPQYSVQTSALLHPLVGGDPSGQNLLAEFDGLTATRNRDRGVWMRDQWFVIDNGRFATNRDSATLLTAGGVDGATPGDWMLAENSVFEGMSQNNVDRFGPCPVNDTSFSGQTPFKGCIDQTPAGGATVRGGDEIGKGYPDPRWNIAGYMIYDGPARLYHDRFVDFKVAPTFTDADQDAVNKWAASHNLIKENGTTVAWVYEGDAALGWFQSNQSSYPTLTNSKELSFVNTDLRHQIYTQLVNLGAQAEGFQDGDKNTAIIDLDGTLDGYIALDPNNNASTLFDGPHPISLNNLMINASGNSVDECQSQGAQDKVLEGRGTSLMSPSSMATLEFQAAYPPARPQQEQTTQFPLQKQEITFTKDSMDFGNHHAMSLTSRNALGVWEPKVTSSLGYTISAAVDQRDNGAAAGIPSVVDVGLIDAMKPQISTTNPFYVRVGICYTSANGSHPQSASDFTITRGYHSYAGGVIGGAGPGDLELRKYYNKLDKLYTDSGGNQQICDNLDGVNKLNNNSLNLLPGTGCPANGITLASQGCPAGTTTGTDSLSQSVCVYPKTSLTALPQGSTIADLTNANGTYKALNNYLYDPSTGWLFFYVVQQDPNAMGPSPLGNCGESATTKDPACPDNANGETYYVCPAQGCTDYVVRLNDANYVPGRSACPDPYDPNSQNNATLPEPVQPYHLAYVGGTDAVVRQQAGAGTEFPHYEPVTPPVCQ